MDPTMLEILGGLFAMAGATRPTRLTSARNPESRRNGHGDTLGSVKDPQTPDSDAVRALARQSDPLIHHQLRVAMLRGVPLSAVRAGPRRGIGRVCFADSTVVLATPQGPGGLGMLAVALHRGAHIRLVGLEATPDGLEMQFSAPPRMPRTLALGLDQAD